VPDNFFIIVPEATTQIFEDPSFEAASLTTYWSVDGTAVNSTDDQFYGAYSAKATVFSGSSTSIYRVISVTETPYTLQCMIKRSGGGVVTNSTHTQARVSGLGALDWDSVSHVQDGWYHCVKTFTPAAGNRAIGIYLKEVDMLADALQLENKAYWTTYTDGDMLGHRDIDGDDDTTGYDWSGTAHASTSTRHAQERSGGRVWDLEDLGAKRIQGFNGWGPPDPQHQISAYALLPGAQYKGRRIPERVIDLPLTLYGTGLENWHDNRLTLTDAVSVDLVEPNQPFTFRYSVGTTPKWLQIDGRYAGGLPGTTPNKTIEAGNLRILAVNPYWRRLKQEVTSLTVNTPTAITNNGYQRALPRLVIQGEGSIDSLVNSTTGQTLGFNFFINPGQVFILDLDNKTIIRKTGSTVESILSAHSSGRINKWWLQRGSNTVEVTASSTGIISTESGDSLLTESGDTLIISSTLSITKCEIQFNETFESVDGISA
jgi:hypothetical protein